MKLLAIIEVRFDTKRTMGKRHRLLILESRSKEQICCMHDPDKLWAHKTLVGTTWIDISRRLPQLKQQDHSTSRRTL